jgi:arabinan endo-1,5-alpha-L-arabinosidase
MLARSVNLRQTLFSYVRCHTLSTSFLYPHGRHYYLFLNWCTCCRGTNSTYNIRVGRSERMTGRYLDRSGVDLMAGGGTRLVGSCGAFVGPGHAGIISKGGVDYLSCHFYDGTHAGTPALALLRLRWRPDGWPEVAE